MLLLPVGMFAPAVAAIPLLFDTLAYTGSLAGWSPRKLRAGYNGYCWRVRRDSDNAPLDVGFTSAGFLNTQAIVDHCGTATGYLVACYDHGTGGFTMTQATASMQPIIYQGGAVTLFQTGGPAAPLWPTSSKTGLSAGVTFGASSDLTVIMALNRVNNGDYQTVASYIASSDGSDGGGSSQNVMYFEGGGALDTYRGASAVVSCPTSGPMVISNVSANAGSMRLAVNNGTPGTGTANNAIASPGALYMGTHAGSDHHCGPLGEMVVAFGTMTAADRVLIERSMGTYWGITVA